MTDTIAGAFELPFDEQVQFFMKKLAMPSRDASRLAAQAHDKGFTVVGAMKADLLNDLQNAVGKAISEGETLESFRDRFDDIVKKHGWTGWTGSDTASGRAWRTQIIYDTNLRTSHAAGRYRQMTTPEMLRMRPVWEYVHTSIENPRLNHKAANGTVRYATDPWWQVNYAPNGYKCGCYIRSLSLRDVERRNLTISSPDDYAADVADVGWEHAAGSTDNDLWQPDYNKYPEPLATDLRKSIQS